MIYAQHINLSFGAQKIFDELSFIIDATQRIGLVGLNGSGKTTLLKAIAGQQLLDNGTITIAKHKTLAYMPQEVVLNSDRTILDETATAFAQVHELHKKQKSLELQLEHEPENYALLEEYGQVCQELNQYNPDALRAETKKILLGLGFTQEQFEASVSTLSVGWKMRIVLAKLLLQKADFYLFDEPTNHLDIIAKDWFLQFLKDAPFGFMLVCHERYVLDTLCSTILELERGKGTFYTGSYTQYEIQKKHALDLLEVAYKHQQKEIQRKTETIARFKAKSSKAKMAQSMMKALEKIERIELPPSSKLINFKTFTVKPSGKVVLKVHDVAHWYGTKRIFHHVSFEIIRSQKIALIAPNGVGKTTLFTIIAGKLPVQHGSIEYGYNVTHALFDQDQTATLDLEKTIFENIYQSTHQKTEQTVRSFLGAFLFSNDDINKKVKVLSGGEKNRVGMVRTLLQDANFLLLDEPTNHLDIPSKEILLHALQEYQGTIFFVSHDHDFINKLATGIIELSAQGTVSYTGNYESYKEQKRHAALLQDKTPSTHTLSSSPEATPRESRKAHTATLKKRSASLEKRITQLEQTIQKIELQFAELIYGTPEFKKAQQALETAQKEHAACLDEWEALEDEIAQDA
jgi:ATP-binding cassette, subfamily F, member 3